jgi:hypothetical protein
MQQHIDETIPRKAGCIFYLTTIALMLAAIATTIAQKQCESTVAMVAAARVAAGAAGTDLYESKVRESMKAAERWRVLCFVAVALGVLSWGVAMRRREKCRWARACVIVLLAFVGALQLMMV